MNYGVGDEVICIDSIATTWPILQLKLGKKYHVAMVNKTCAAMDELLEDKIFHGLPCAACGLIDNLGHYAPWRFIKLDGLKEEQEQEMTA